jgi:hypothetical protein
MTREASYEAVQEADRAFFRSNPGRITYLRPASDIESAAYGALPAACSLAMVVRKIDDARRLSLFVLVPNDGQPLPNDEESCAAIFDGIWNSLPETGILSRMWRKLRACIKLCGSSHRRSQPRPR